MPEILRADTADAVDTVDAAQRADERFLELLCADEDLLRAEFDAIIAEEWPSPPPIEPDQGVGAPRGPRHAGRRHEVRAVATQRRPRHPGVGGWARQRSPPAGPRTRHAPDRRGR